MKVFKYNHGDKNWFDCYGGFYFIHTWPVDDKGQLSHHKSVNSCREFFTLAYQNAIWNNSREKDQSAKAFALIISGRKPKGNLTGHAFNTKIKNSVLLLNAFESYYKIPKTRIYPVICEQFVEKAFIVGSKRWTNSRYSLGIWTIFFRFCQSNVFKGRDIQKLIPTMKWPEVKDRIIGASSGNNTISQAKTIFNHIDNFLEFEKLHLKGSTREQNWDPELVGNGNQRPEGIVKLVSGHSYSLKLKRLWAKFEEESKEKK